MMNSYLKMVIASGCIALAAACSITGVDDTSEKDQRSPRKGEVSLTINNESLITKSGQEYATETKSIIADLSFESGINGLVLEETVSGIDQMPVATKGTPVFTENFSDVYSAGFKAAAVYDCSTKQPISGLAGVVFEKKADSDLWAHDYGEMAMPEKALFFFNAPATIPNYINTTGYNATDKSVSFSLVPANYPKTAAEQQDILFTSEEIYPDKVNSITFYHAFAAVKFKQGNTDDLLKITKIDMSNLLTSGTCKLTPKSGSKSSAVSVWSQTEKSYATFSQTYDGKISYDEADGYFGSEFYKNAVDESNLNLNGDSKATTTFMCVPQSFSESDSDHVIVTITFTCNGVTKTAQVDFSKSLKGKTWEPGKLYTYSFNITDLSVSVEDNVTGDTKDNVVITNTGNTNGFIRAAITSYWTTEIDGEQVIIKNCDYNTEGTLTGLGSDWIKGSDGYYYYKYGVKGGEPTNQALFTSYKAGQAPIDGASLQMSILAQIVAARTAWGTVPTGLSDTIED